MQTQISFIDHLASKKQTQPLAESIAHSFIKFNIPVKYLSLKVYQKKNYIYAKQKDKFLKNEQTNSRTCSHNWSSLNRSMHSSSNNAAIMEILGNLALELHIPLTVFTNRKSFSIRDGFHVCKQKESSQNLVLCRKWVIKADKETFTQKLCYSSLLWQYHRPEGCCGP